MINILEKYFECQTDSGFDKYYPSVKLKRHIQYKNTLINNINKF